MENMHEEISEIKQMLTDIHVVVVGSVHDRESGLLERVKKLEKKGDSFSRIFWLVVGGGSVICFLIKLLLK